MRNLVLFIFDLEIDFWFKHYMRMLLEMNSRFWEEKFLMQTKIALLNHIFN